MARTRSVPCQKSRRASTPTRPRLNDTRHLYTRIDHDPACFPARHVPLTASTPRPSRRRSASFACASRSTPALHVPEYSVLPPVAIARQAPVQPAGDFAADHPPRATVWPRASERVHVPVDRPSLRICGRGPRSQQREACAAPRAPRIRPASHRFNLVLKGVHARGRVVDRRSQAAGRG